MLTVLLRLWLCLHLQPLCALRRAQILLRHPLLPGLLCLTLGCDSSPQSSQALCLDGQQPGESLKSPPGPGKHGVYASLVSQPQDHRAGHWQAFTFQKERETF